MGKPIDLVFFQGSLRARGIKDENNVFLVPLKKLKLREIVSQSRWVQQKSYSKERFQSAVFYTYMLTEKMELTRL